jgi:hypothetical protein
MCIPPTVDMQRLCNKLHHAKEYILNIRYTGQGEARHRKYKRFKLGGGHVYDPSSV